MTDLPAPPPPPSASTGLFNSPVLVVNQKVKLIEVRKEYAIFNGDGHQVGAVRQIGQNWFKKLLRILGNWDQFFTHRLEIVDGADQVLLRVIRPAKIFKSKFHVEDGNGNQIGLVKQSNVFGKIGFSFEVHGEVIGGIKAENWRAWDFQITDHSGVEVARITKKWEGFAKTMFTTADNYVVQIHRELQDPLRSLVVASALTVDTALKQDSRGFN